MAAAVLERGPDSPGSPQTPLAAANRALSRLLESSGIQQLERFSLTERRFAYEAACRCIEDCGARCDAPTKALLFFRADKFDALRTALGVKGQLGLYPSGKCSTPPPFVNDAVPESPGSVDSRGSANKITALWKSVQKTTNSINKSINKTANQLSGLTINLKGKSSGSPQRSMGAALPGDAPPLPPEPFSSGCLSDEDACGAVSSSGGSGSGSAAAQMERAFEALLAAAPMSGDAAHWVWLLATFSERCGLATAPARMQYLARAAEHVSSCDADWLRLLHSELCAATSSGAGARDAARTALPSEARTVCEHATAAAEAAIANYRTNYTTAAANADMLALAVQLLSAAASHMPGGNSWLDEALHGMVDAAARRRYFSLRRQHCCGEAVASPAACMRSPAAPPRSPLSPNRAPASPHRPSASPSRAPLGTPPLNPALSPVVMDVVDVGGGDAAPLPAAGLAGLARVLVGDVLDDAEHYHAVFPRAANISLPSVSCRVYCLLLHADLVPLLGADLPLDRGLLDLVAQVHRLEGLAGKWCARALAQGHTARFTDERGVPLFTPHVDRWFGAQRAELTALSARLLERDAWMEPCSSSGRGSSGRGGGGGPRCSRSLADFYRALCACAEQSAQVMAAHRSYAALMERTLSRALLTHAGGLERLSLSMLPPARTCSGGVGAAAAGGLTGGGGAGWCEAPFRPPAALAVGLNDLRELRSRQTELAAAVKRNLPSDWWGGDNRSTGSTATSSSTGSCLRTSSSARAGGSAHLGDRFRLCQGEMERRYTGVLAALVRRMTAPLRPCVEALLECAEASGSDSDDAAALSVPFRLQPVTCGLDEGLEALSPHLDARVMKRLTRELWNTAAGVLQELLLREGDEQGGPGSSYYNSVDCVGPRIRAADAALRYFSEYFTAGCAYVGLRRGDEPEKARQLSRLLAFFLREDGADSLDALGSR